MDRIENLRKLLDKLNCDAALLTSFPSLFYFSGFTSCDAYLLVTKSEQYIITDSRYTLQVKAECGNFSLIDGSNSNFELIKPIIVKENIRNIAFEDLDLTVSKYGLLTNSVGEIALTPLKNSITELRRKKSKAEIKKIAEALRLSEYALTQTISKIKVGMTEVEVASILESKMRSCGASKTSFDTICASGTRSALPHGAASDKPIENGDFLTLDFGCVLDGYCSDITRTFIVGIANEKQIEIYNTVLKAQTESERIICSGLSCKDADNTARKVINAAGYGKNFGHSLGHGVGIEIHELPSLSPRSEAVLSHGDIVTVEPGIYVEGFGGVRIEDMVYIEDDKTEILTKFPKKLTIL